MMDEDSSDALLIVILLPLIVAGIIVSMFAPHIVYEVTAGVGAGLGIVGMVWFLMSAETIKAKISPTTTEK